MTNYLTYVDIAGLIFFAIALIYSLRISYKVKNEGFLKKVNDPAKVEAYRLIASPKLRLVNTILILIFFVGLFRHARIHSGHLIYILILGLAIFIFSIVQSSRRFKKK